MSIDINACSYEDYARSVSELLKMALQHDGNSAGAAAQVLLSAFNGYEFQLNVTSLGYLDENNQRHAFNVLAGRAINCTEPHELLTNGNSHFSALWRRWEVYHISNRNLQDCPTCSGSGREWQGDDENGSYVTCTTCKGGGKVNEPAYRSSLLERHL